MIPLAVGVGIVAAAGVALLSDDDKKNSETTSTRTVSDDFVKQKMARMGRPIKTVGVKITDSTKKIIKSQTAVSPVERVKQIIAEQLDLNENQIQMSSRIVEDLGANYNDKCIILDLIGGEFNVNFFGKEIRTVGNIFNYIDPNSQTNQTIVKSKPSKRVIKSQTSVSPFERVQQIIAEQLDLNENQIQMSSRIVEDLGANYNDKCIILDLIGEEFNVNFFGKEIRTVGNIFNYIG